MSDTVETSTPTEASPADTSLADHESQFGPPSKRQPVAQPSDSDGGSDQESDASLEGDRDAKGQYRRRAQSQQGTAKDVDEINALTKRLREAEAEAGFTIERKQGESQRVFELRRKAEIAEAIRDAKRARTTSPVVPRPPAAPRVDPSASFDKPQPKLEDFATEPDPYSAWMDAKQDWKIDKRDFEHEQAHATQYVQQSQQEMLEQAQRHYTSHQQRLAAFAPTKPDWEAALESVEDLGEVPPLLALAFVTDDKGPELMYHLATHPDRLSEMMLLAAGQPVTEQSVALLRRRLHAQVQDVSTGASAPARSMTVAPRPPTPVRTGPLKTADEPPGDDSSLADHEKAYGPRGRFARRR